MADLKTYQPSFTSGEISPALYARTDLAKYKSALRRALNTFVHPHGGISNRAGLEWCVNTKYGDKSCRLIPFQFSTTQAYILELGEGYFRVLKDGSYIVTSGSAIDLIGAGNPSVIAAVAHGFVAGQDIYISGYPWPIGGRIWRVLSVPTVDSFTVADQWGVPLASALIPAPGLAEPILEVATPYDEASLRAICATQEADVQYWTHRSFDIEKLSRFSETNWTLTVPTFAPSMTAPTPAPVAVPLPTSGSVTAYDYVISAVSGDTGEESLASLPSNSITNNLTTAGNKNTITWTAVTGASRYIVYKKDNGVYGYIGSTEALTFVDQNITADLADTPQKGQNPFVGDGNHPAVSTFYEQRLMFGSTDNQPQAVWGSQTTNYENFGYSSPAKASDALSFRIRARQVNVIRAMLPTRGLMLLTSGAEWTVSGGSQDFLSPAQIVIKNEGYRGAAEVQPVVVGNTIMFAQRSGGVIRDFSFDFTNDSFTGQDLTILARHLFEGKTVLAWAYAQALYSMVWVVLDDNSLVSLTYLKEHEVWAWTRHDVSGVVEDVAVIDNGVQDVPYFVVQRTVNGQTKRYIERLTNRLITTAMQGNFLDSSRTYSGSPTNTITGFAHLEGQVVNALVDGNVVRDLVVTNGTVTLPDPGSLIHIGLQVTSEIQTLEVDMGTVRGIGTVQGRMKGVAGMTVRVEKSRGMFIGGNDNSIFTEWKQRAAEAYDTAIDLYTGDFNHTIDPDWSTIAPITIRQTDPLPMTILAVMPEIELGE